jgi:hypothetical protein
VTTRSPAAASKAAAASRGLGVGQEIAEDVAPEAVEAFPGDPGFGPAAFGVGGEDDTAAEAVLPAGEEGVALVDAEDGFSGGFGDEFGVAAQGGGGLHADAVEDFGGAFDDWNDGLFNGRQPVNSITSLRRICSRPEGSLRK